MSGKKEMAFSVTVWWWAFQLMACSVLKVNICNGQSLDGVSRSGFPGLHEIAKNALYLYRMPVADRSNIGQLSSYWYEDRLYKPEIINFTCSGNITKLKFIAWKGKLEEPGITDTRLRIWPRFSILRISNETETTIYYHQLELLVSNYNPVALRESGNIGIYEIELSANNFFKAGDQLGVWQPLYHNSSSRYAVTLLHQRYGGHSVYDFSQSILQNVVFENYDSFFPLVSIETGNDCTHGSLNNESLEMIIEALNKNQSINSLFFSSNNQHYVSPNTAFISHGVLTKWTFAARFNYSNRELPHLQIWRKVGHDHFTKVHSFSMEPKRTGYLNIFEMDLSNISTEVESGDLFGVYQPCEDEARYSIAFLEGKDSPPTYILQNLTIKSDVKHLSSFTMMKMQPLVTATLDDTFEESFSTTSTVFIQTDDTFEESFSTTSTVFIQTGETNSTFLTRTNSEKSANDVTIVSGALSGICMLLFLMFITVTVVLMFVCLRYKCFTRRTQDIVVAFENEGDQSETHSMSSEMEESGLLIHSNEAYSLDSHTFAKSEEIGTNLSDLKDQASNESSYEDLSGGQSAIYDYIDNVSDAEYQTLKL